MFSVCMKSTLLMMVIQRLHGQRINQQGLLEAFSRASSRMLLTSSCSINPALLQVNRPPVSPLLILLCMGSHPKEAL